MPFAPFEIQVDFEIGADPLWTDPVKPGLYKSFVRQYCSNVQLPKFSDPPGKR